MLTISIIALLISVFGLYKLSRFEADSIIYDSENLDVYDDLEQRINTLEYSVKAHTKNVEILAGRITNLEMDIINLRNDVKKISNEMQNTSTSLNNITAFVDKTRAMAEENSRRIDRIEDSERN